MLSIQAHIPDRHLDDAFAFHPRASNPELWRTTVPLIVRLKCGRHKGLVSTWTAIHWLIVLYAASGRCAFGMREIAQEAGVGRNELAGPKGHIQRLVALGLLTIVGYEPVPGVKEPRPIYHIDLAELERQSLELIPAMLCERRLPPPPRPAPNPRQMDLFDAGAHGAGTAAPVPTGPSPAFGQPAHGNRSVAPASCPTPPLLQPSRHGIEPGTHEIGTAGVAHHELLAPAEASTHGNGTVNLVCDELLAPAPTSMHGNGAAGVAHHELLAPAEASTHGNGTGVATDQKALSLVRAGTHETGTDTHENLPDHARNRDVERKSEEKEGESEIAHTRDFQQIVAATAQTVILVLQQKGIIPRTAGAAPADTPASLEVISATPAGQPALRASVVALWQGDRPSLSPREHTQLALLADSYDAATGGFGAYWLGRAIMLADLCLSERGRPLSLTYVRKMLRRWADEGSWGSDLACEDAGAASRRPELRMPLIQTPKTAAPALPPAPAASEVLTAVASVQPAVAPISGSAEHPAIAAYQAAFGRELNQVQAEEIAKTVTDLGAWQQVLHDWQLNTWDAESVGNMLDRYGKKAGLPSSATMSAVPASTLEIYQHADLSDDERQRWLRRVSLAAPADKLQLLLQFRKEHPHA